MKKLIIASAILLPLLLQGCYPAIERNQSAKTIITDETQSKDSGKEVSLYRDLVLEYSNCTDKTRENEALEKSKQVSCDIKSAKEKAVSAYYDINFEIKPTLVKEGGKLYHYINQKGHSGLLKKYGYENQVGSYNALLFYLVLSDGDFDTAANIYSESHKHLNDKDAKFINTAKLLKNIDKVSGKNLPSLSRALKEQGYIYESFFVSIQPENNYSDPSSKENIINTLERFNCYDDSLLWINYFIKSSENSYDDLGEKYNQIIGSMNKEQIAAMNSRTREYVKNGKAPPVSSTCEINAYKKLDF